MGSSRPLPGRVWRTRAVVVGLFASLVGLLVVLLSFPMLLSDPVPGDVEDPLWFRIVYAAGVVAFVGGLVAVAAGVLTTLALVLVRAIRT